MYFVEHLETPASGSWTCYEIKDIDSTEFFIKMKPTSPPPVPPPPKNGLLKVSVENSS